MALDEIPCSGEMAANDLVYFLDIAAYAFVVAEVTSHVLLDAVSEFGLCH
ncbi:hypothetical protein U8P68_37870 (plasmid) [Rhizobium ruizarguesonis]|nr:hypothetical protein U8P68_37870 [Rhizobium ruizarguesonis]